MLCLEKQSPDIAHGVWETHDADNVGAGDQVSPKSNPTFLLLTHPSPTEFLLKKIASIMYDFYS